jgi:hypothetical protein
MAGRALAASSLEPPLTRVVARARQRAISLRYARDRLDAARTRFGSVSGQWPSWHPRAYERLIRSADDFRDGTAYVFSHPFDLRRHGWNANPMTGVEYPRLYSRRIPQMDFRRYGDVKYSYELNKHYGFVELVCAAAFTGDSTYVDTLSREVAAWRRCFPAGLGVAWGGNVHISQRMIAWLFTWLVLTRIPEERRDSLDRLLWVGLREHAAVLRNRYRVPANNHMLGSLCTLLIVAWFVHGPDSAAARRWCDELTGCTKILVSAEGAPMEGSLAYGLLVLEFLVMLNLFARVLGGAVPSEVAARTRAMLSWYEQMAGPERFLPPLGDASGECAFPFTADLWDAWDGMSLGQAAFGEETTRELGPGGQLCADLFRIAPRVGAMPRSPSVLFLDKPTGYARLSRRTGAGRWTLWMRGGQFGFPPDYGHAHCDDLSPLVCLDGVPLLWESGTYRYSVEPQDRCNDVLSWGHSGIRCDARERATWIDLFRWSGEPLAAELDGDAHSLTGRLVLPDRSTLRRQVTVSEEGVVIHDRFESTSRRERLFEWSFILEGTHRDSGAVDDGTVRLKHSLEPLELLLRFARGWSEPRTLGPVRISTGYGRSHTGTRVFVRAIEPGDWTRVTVLKSTPLKERL